MLLTDLESWVSYSCPIGNDDYQNRVLYEFHAFSIITVISLSTLFFFNNTLRKIYLPLHRVVNAALLLQLIGDCIYFYYFPYPSMNGNCADIIVNRVCIMLIMFGEMHQLYFMAKVLGLSRFKLKWIGTVTMSSLESMLRIMTLLGVVTIFSSLFIKRLFMMTHDIWALLIISSQLVIINSARSNKNENERVDEAIIDSNNEAVRIFEILTWLQLLPLLVAFLDRVLEYDGIFILVPLDGVMLILEFLSIYLFYIKVLLLREKGSNMNVMVYNL